MNSKQSRIPFCSLRQQHGDAAVNLVVALAAAILGFLFWQYYLAAPNQEQLHDQAISADSTSSVQTETGTANLLERQQETLRAPNPQGLSEQQSDGSVESTVDIDPSSDNNLPPLDNSDQFVRENLARLSETRTWKTWISTAQPIRKFSQFIDNVARGKVPHKYFRFMAPAGKFKVLGAADDEFTLDPAGYHRYDLIAKCIDSLDAATVVSTYETLEPLVQAAWSELKSDQAVGSRHAFDQVLLSAINKIRSAPAINDEIRLIRPSVMYKFADPKLERMNAVSKQMIRMGPRNTRMIQKKLDEIENLLKTQHSDTLGGYNSDASLLQPIG